MLLPCACFEAVSPSAVNVNVHALYVGDALSWCCPFRLNVYKCIDALLHLQRAGGVHPGCLASVDGVASAAGRCLYVNETLPHVVTPLFAVQQMASIWDTQCNLAGQIYTLGQGAYAMLQVACIVGKSDWHICFQYSDSCSSAQVEGM
jgi:hypothetical protein